MKREHEKKNQEILSMIFQNKKILNSLPSLQLRQTFKKLNKFVAIVSYYLNNKKFLRAYFKDLKEHNKKITSKHASKILFLLSKKYQQNIDEIFLKE